MTATVQRSTEGGNFLVYQCRKCLSVVQVWHLIRALLQQLSEMVRYRSIVQLFINGIATQQLDSVLQPPLLILMTELGNNAKQQPNNREATDYYQGILEPLSFHDVLLSNTLVPFVVV